MNMPLNSQHTPSAKPTPHIPLDEDGLFCPMIFDSPSDTDTPTPSSTSAPTEEELRNLREQEALSLALCPHDKDGFAVPLIPVGDSKYAREVGNLNFPVITPDSEGLSTPILFGRDFVDGQHPEGFGYAPGCAHPMRFSSCNSLDNVIFDDAQFNLPKHQQQLLQWAQAVTSQMTNAPTENRSGNTKNSPVIISAHGQTTFLVDNERTPLANFSIEVVERNCIIVRGENDSEFVILRVLCDGLSRELSIRTTELENLVSIIIKRFPSCHLDVDASKASARLVNLVRDQLKSAPTRIIIRSAGFIKLPSCWVYAHDGAVPPTPSISFDTGCTIPLSSGGSPRTAMMQALDFLELSAKKPLTLPLFLLAHLGLTFELFAAAGYQPKFVTFLNGTTGSFKTAIATCLFRTFLESPTTAEASFRDTPTALEVGLGSAYSRVFLLDDYQPALTAASQKFMLDKLEFIIRLVGDGIGKNRSNAELGRAKTFKPVGCCLITGEDVGGSRSSLLRCLVLPIGKGDISGEKLKCFQDHPEFLWSHWYHFVEWAGHHGDAIINLIKTDFQQRRNDYAKFLHEPRQVDIAATLTLTGRILLEYGRDIGCVRSDSIASIADEWCAAVLEAMLISEGSSRTLSPIALFLQAVFDLQATHNIIIAPDQSAYHPKNHIGFAKDLCWCLMPHEIYRRVRQYWRETGKMFPLQETPLFQLLCEAELIETEIEHRAEKDKVYCTKRSTLPGRPRLLYLRVDEARDYLEKLENE